MNDREALKRMAAERAVDLVQDGMLLGLGTGSTARHVLEVLAERRSRGELRSIEGVATSTATEQLAIALGIPVHPLNDVLSLDLGIDGADEVDPYLDLIKGLGGALLWEKIVAAACTRFVVVIDESKLVDRLGLRAPLPVEVVPFGWKTHIALLADMNARAELRLNKDGQPFLTDGGHYILDCWFDDGIEDPSDVDAVLQLQPGVVESGLFVEMTSLVIVAGETGVSILDQPL